MSYTHFRVDSINSDGTYTYRLGGYVNGDLYIRYNNLTRYTINSAQTMVASCKDLMMYTDITFTDSSGTVSAKVSCKDKIMPCNLRIVTSVSEYGYYQIFTGGGTFVVPANVTSISAMCVGGGGAGGRYRSMNYGELMGGGGGGGRCAKSSISVTPGESLTITVGAGGTALRQSSSVRNGCGSASSIARGSTTLLTASGGDSPVVNKYWSEGGEYWYYEQDIGGYGGAGGGGGGEYDYDPNDGNQYFSCGGNGGDNGGNGASGVAVGGDGQGSSSVYSALTGVYYSGGGGGGNAQQGTGVASRGGYTGGGKGANAYGINKGDAVAGTANTGGGGGGGSTSYWYENHGGSGIVLLNW